MNTLFRWLSSQEGKMMILETKQSVHTLSYLSSMLYLCGYSSEILSHLHCMHCACACPNLYKKISVYHNLTAAQFHCSKAADLGGPAL